MKREAHYKIEKVDREKETLWIKDLDGPLSVTNDAEHVVDVLNRAYPAFRIYYQDTMGRWDELVHRNGIFIRFDTGRGP